MLQKIFYVLTWLLTTSLILILNGNLSFSTSPVPPMGKFLNPFGGAWTSDTRSEKTNQTLQMEGLKDKVEIIYDDRRVAHIFAQNIEDALFAQGYAEAQNRLFQMQFLTMVASGELSSVIGDKTLEIDLEKRRRGMKYSAENAVKGWAKSEDYNSVYRYVDGINAYIGSLRPEDYPLEFKLFDFQPTQWTALKSALIFKQMSLTLAGRDDDVENTNLLYHLGKENFDYLYPERQLIENPVIPTEQAYAFDSLYGNHQSADAYYQHPILKTNFENRNKGIGSNSWGVSGSKTKTGKPIFCNDPHLSLGLPSIWFEVHIHTPEFNAYGVSFPGFPGIMIGFNEHIAWGETNVGQDVEDMFVIQWANEEKTKYIVDGEERDVELRIEKVEVKCGQTILDTVKYTIWGPVYHTSNDGTQDLAMRWICHDEPNSDEYNVFIDAMKCRNYDDYKKATGKYQSPAQNFGFAAKDGDIALRVNGRFPAKYDQDGRFVEMGNKKLNGWQAWIPRDQNPQIINPKRGFISSANQVSADKTYPYYFTGKFERYRNRSVNGILSEKEGITIEDMQQMQQNSFSHKAADYVKTLKDMDLDSQLDDQSKAGYGILTNWNYEYQADNEAPTFFDIFYKKLAENTWDELLDLKEKMDINLPEAWRLLEMIQTHPDHAFFDIVSTEKKENATDIIIKSLKDAADTFEKFKAENKDASWGTYKPLHIYHLTRIPAFSEMNIAANGCPDAINATGYSFGPSWRMVISLEDKIKGYAVYPGGQSGNPTSKYYKNMISAWTKGEYYPLKLASSLEELRSLNGQNIQLAPK